MKISSASKKVLASALSAAMVVAFAPTVAFARTVEASTAPTAKLTITSQAAVTGAPVSYEVNYYDTAGDNATTADTSGIDKAFDAVEGLTADGIVVETGSKKDTAGNVVKAYGKITWESNKYQIQDWDIDANAAVSGAAEKDLTVNKLTVSLLADTVDTTQYTGDKDVTLDLGGKTLVNASDADDAAIAGNATTGDGDTLSVTGSGKVTVTNGTVSAIAYKATPSSTPAAKSAIDAAGKNIVLDGGTYGAVAAANVEAKGEVKAAGVTASTGVTVKKKGSLESTVSGKGAQTAVSGAVTLEEGASINASATSTENDATAIDGAVNASDTQGVKDITVTATAKADKAANGVTGTVNAKKGTVAVKADSATGVATALKGGVIAAGTVEASGSSAANSIAVGGASTITGGTFDGKIANLGSASVTGGSFTENPKAFVNTAEYNIAYAGGVYTVGQFKGFTTSGNFNGVTSGTNAQALADFADNALQEIAKGATSVDGLTFAEGIDAAKLLDIAKENEIKVKLEVKGYFEKNATDAQKAAKKAIEDAVKADLGYTDSSLFKTVTVKLQYTKAGNTVELGTVTNLGKVASGLSTVDNAVEFTGTELGTLGKNVTVWGYTTAAGKMAYVDDDNDGTPDTPFTVRTGVIPTVFATSTLDQDAIKDMVKDNDKPAAAEKATQGIDVAKKSKTVKIKSAKKTKKAQSFNMGLSAQTAVTTAKASGSKYVTVKGGKVTLKKGAKKGTYKAKVTINAAASDAYLAAAKTVTVTFKVTK